MSFRRFVHLVVDDMNIRRCTYSLRSIDMSALFRRPAHSSIGAHPPPIVENQEMESCPLPAPSMSFCPPRGRCHEGMMEFMFLGGKHNKVVATDQTGRALLYDPDQHAVNTLHGFVKPKDKPVALTVDEDHLYVLDTRPAPGHKDTCFECLEFDDHYGMDEDWYPRVLPPPPPHNCNGPADPKMEEEQYYPVVDSCAVSGDGSHISITNQRSRTYAFDTATEAWSKVGDWALPFSGVAEHVPELGLWFGLSRDEDRCELCVVDLHAPPAAASVRGLWMAVTRVVFTAVEVERCNDDGVDGGLRMVKHGSKLFTLLQDMAHWVL
ncbi:hypothetical protein PR202_gb24140 [Eleusine coracana subsp. coracana]|uniref:Uncharacterized protein n=1 Tax=Eleusine coracana subsp. coracana TaxID=191504 RepID=A0AAV5FM69_ELECO|nr:hypothetical protein PR202_gb24140 [Eleusine coracana subsp. coracana]